MHDGRVTKDREDDSCRMTSIYRCQLGFWLDLGGQRLLEGKQQLSTHVIISRRSPCARAQAVKEQRVCS